MYQQLAVLTLLLFCYSVVAARVEKSLISGPMLFVFAGVLCGPVGLQWFSGDATQTELRVIADLTLALILFIDAANANLATLRRSYHIPGRMLLLGLPGVLLTGFALALWVFDQMSVYEAAILATILAATDAALGKAVVSNSKVPETLREGLNAESGLNDGLCVPILLVLIALAQGRGEEGGDLLAITLVAQELGIGLLIGVGLTLLAAAMMRFCYRRGWVTKVWLHISVVAIAVGIFSVAQSLHGSGYIAAFTGGLLFGHLMKEHTHDLLLAAESDGETLALVTWFVFGLAVVGQVLPLFNAQIVLYSLLSLTVIRVLPIFLSLSGSGLTPASRLFLAWFGPRGLASIVFAIIVLNAGLEGGETIAIVVVCTVLMSLIAHGLSANPLVHRLSDYLSKRENAS
ncbi:cation:proton antiporter [Ferrimonas marina]|uniref:NhaP-type Na+/H+ or K+/H+ antiporter n=1 Tax=Ferrimonas marina TaxID=299255 RepID=A0A1M5NEC4_9GAMM|nr:cation:proton antiporter [Ferrimonas marina]SHG87812.1 NhaP-type Na+/H+ or K+/H+ antiporter [Ferrimonas marina]